MVWCDPQPASHQDEVMALKPFVAMAEAVKSLASLPPYRANKSQLKEP